MDVNSETVLNPSAMCMPAWDARGLQQHSSIYAAHGRMNWNSVHPMKAHRRTSNKCSYTLHVSAGADRKWAGHKVTRHAAMGECWSAPHALGTHEGRCRGKQGGMPACQCRSCGRAERLKAQEAGALQPPVGLASSCQAVPLPASVAWYLGQDRRAPALQTSPRHSTGRQTLHHRKALPRCWSLAQVGLGARAGPHVVDSQRGPRLLFLFRQQCLCHSTSHV